MAELLIFAPDGSKKSVPLTADRLTVGRSMTADLPFPEDNGLSRLHAAFERAGETFILRDLQSKNGTTINGRRISIAQVLKPNDKIACGRLLIVFDPQQRSSGVVFVQDKTPPPSGSTIVTTLGGIISEAQQREGSESHLSALIEASNELSGERPLPELFQRILDLAIEAVNADRGVLLLMEDGALVERAGRGQNFTISTAVRDQVMEGKLSVLVRNTSMDAALRERQSIIAANIRTLMAVPLQARDSVLGLLYVDSPSLQREFTREDLSLLTVMASVATIRIERSRLAEAEQARKLMLYELDQAESIQRQALPRGAPKVEGIEIAGYNAASRTVGGDYYDFFPDGKGHVGVIVADVSGKGMAAALMMMAYQARAQSLFAELPVEAGALKRVMNQLNSLTVANCPSGKFVTAFACVVDGRSGRVDWASAGHNPPLLVRRDGSYELLREGGPMMGIFPGLTYDQFAASLEAGDLLAIYSDGITEATSPDDKDFDIPILAAVLAENRRSKATDIVQATAKRLQEWTHGAPPADDITLVIVRKI